MDSRIVTLAIQGQPTWKSRSYQVVFKAFHYINQELGRYGTSVCLPVSPPILCAKNVDVVRVLDVQCLPT